MESADRRRFAGYHRQPVVLPFESPASTGNLFLFIPAWLYLAISITREYECSARTWRTWLARARARQLRTFTLGGVDKLQLANIKPGSRVALIYEQGTNQLVMKSIQPTHAVPASASPH